MKKYNKIKKMVSCSLAAMLLLSACGSSTEESSKKTSASEAAGTSSLVSEGENTTNDEPVKLTIAVKQHSNDILTDVGEKAVLQEAAEVLGYEIEWIGINESAVNEQVGPLLTDNKVDVYWGLLGDSLVTANSKLFLTLEDKIEQYCPNVYATYQESVDGWEQYLTYPDGHIYGLMGGELQSSNNSVQGTFWINQTWLDAVGKEVPTTMTELVEVLSAFRDNDMDGDGDKSNEIPLDFCQQHYAAKYCELAHCFGLAISNGSRFYNIEDGKVVPLADSDAFREFLEYFHSLVEDGLANKEGVTQTQEQYNANISNGIVGAFWGWAPYTYITDAEKAAEYVPVAPISADGYTFSDPFGGWSCTRNSWVIAEKCENWEAALKLWDYLSRDEEACYTIAKGAKDLTWEWVDGIATSRAYTSEEAIAAGYPEDIASNAGTSAFTASVGIINVGPLVINSLAPAEGTNTAIRGSATDLYQDYLNPALPKTVVPAEIKEEFDFTCEGLVDYINSFAVESIQNGVTDDSWNAHLTKLGEYNYDYYIEYNQKVLDSDF